MYQARGKFFIEETDQCLTCRHKNYCTTLQLLGSGLVYINEEFTNINFESCKFYEQTLTIVGRANKANQEKAKVIQLRKGDEENE